jgi:hypothetical protein
MCDYFGTISPVAPFAKILLCITTLPHQVAYQLCQTYKNMQNTYLTSVKET